MASPSVTLQVAPVDYQQVEQQLALENLGLRRELVVCVRAVNECRAEIARLRAENEALKAQPSPAKKGRKP